MAATTSFDHAIQQHDDEPGATSRRPVLPTSVSFAASSIHPYEDEFDNEKARAPPRVQFASELQDDELSPQLSKTSKSIRLEPPPVVMRPPKVKYSGFKDLTSSWLSWTRNSEQDTPDCARSQHWSYTSRSSFHLFGFSFASDLNFKSSDGGIDTATRNIRIGFGKSQAHWQRDFLPKIRRRFGTSPTDGEPQSADEERQDGISQEESSTTAVEGQKHPQQYSRFLPRMAHRWLNDHYYVVVGLMSDETVPNEVIRRVARMDGLFHQIRAAHRQLRNPIRRLLSLKEISGFGIYQCDPSKGYHHEADLDPETENALAELWRSYNSHKLDYEGRWLMWIHQHFNNSSKNPEHGRLSLKFKLRWSVFKVVIWGVVPILLSLAVGFWYMYSDHGEIDDVAVAEAAWVIATYIITTSALIFALLAVITQLGNV